MCIYDISKKVWFFFTDSCNSQNFKSKSIAIMLGVEEAEREEE